MHPSKAVPSGVMIVMAGMTVLTLTSSQVQAAPGNTIFGKAIRPQQPAPALPRTLFIPSISDPELEYRILHDDATQLNDRLSVLGYKKTQVVPVKPDRSTLIALQSIIREQLATTSPNKKQFIQLPLRAELPHASGPDKMYALLLQPHSMFKRFGLNNVAGQNKKQTFAILGVFRLSESLAPNPQLPTHLGLYGFATQRTGEYSSKGVTCWALWLSRGLWRSRCTYKATVFGTKFRPCSKSATHSPTLTSL